MLVILYNVLFFILTDLVEARHNALSFLLLQIVSISIRGYKTESNQNPPLKLHGLHHKYLLYRKFSTSRFSEKNVRQ